MKIVVERGVSSTTVRFCFCELPYAQRAGHKRVLVRTLSSGVSRIWEVGVIHSYSWIDRTITIYCCYISARVEHAPGMMCLQLLCFKCLTGGGVSQ